MPKESMTAKLCSFARAYHSMLGKDKIFDDYLAYDMMGGDEYKRINRLVDGCADVKTIYGFESLRVFEELNSCFSPVALSRTAFAERALLRFAERSSDSEYVILGAGMDTFAFRNTDESIEIFEVDKPATLDYKRERIRELNWGIPVGLHFVPLDFEKDDLSEELLLSGFSPKKPSFFSLLGVSYYLTEPALFEVIESFASLAAPGSQFVLDYPDEERSGLSASPRVRQLITITREMGEPMQRGFSLARLHQKLEENGLFIRRHATPTAIEREFFTGRTDKQRAMENIHYLLVEKR